MPDKIKIPYNGQMAEGTLVGVNHSFENWNDYTLDDGSSLRIKFIITKVVRLDNIYDAEGNPVYVFQSTSVASVNASNSLKRKE